MSDNVLPFPGKLKPWEKLEKESTKHYWYFTVFRDLGPSRKPKLVSQKVGIALPTLYTIMARHKWQDRAAAYDQHILQSAQAVVEQDSVAEIARHRKKQGLQVLEAIDCLGEFYKEFKKRFKDDPDWLGNLQAKELIAVLLKANAPMMDAIKLAREIFGIADPIRDEMDSKIESIEDQEQADLLETNQKLASFFIEYGSDSAIRAITKPDPGTRKSKGVSTAAKKSKLPKPKKQGSSVLNRGGSKGRKRKPDRA